MSQLRRCLTYEGPTVLYGRAGADERKGVGMTGWARDELTCLRLRTRADSRTLGRGQAPKGRISPPTHIYTRVPTKCLCIRYTLMAVAVLQVYTLNAIHDISISGCIDGYSTVAILHHI